MISLRRATEEDSDFLLFLRNDPSVRGRYFDDREITSEEHKKWFSNNKEIIFIIENKSEKVGQIKISPDDSLSISILPAFRGRGYATEAILRTVSYFFSIPGKEVLIADILEGNEASKKVFLKSGFKYKESLAKEGKKFERYILEKKGFCEECGFLNPRNTATAVIVRDSKILLLKRNFEPFKDWWDLPGGYVEWGELPEDAMQRELLEELNVSGNLVYIKSFTGTNEYKGKVHSVISSVFLATFSGEIKLDDENKEYGWFSVADLPPIAFDSNKKILDMMKNAWFDLQGVRSLVSQLDATARVEEFSLYKAFFEGHMERIYDGGKLIAMGWIFPRQTMVRKQAVIEDMIVDETYRGRGYGREILRRLIAWAKNEGVEVIELTTNPKRIAANELYKSEGFVLHETNHYLLRLR